MSDVLPVSRGGAPENGINFLEGDFPIVLKSILHDLKMGTRVFCTFSKAASDAKMRVLRHLSCSPTTPCSHIVKKIHVSKNARPVEVHVFPSVRSEDGEICSVALIVSVHPLAAQFAVNLRHFLSALCVFLVLSGTPYISLFPTTGENIIDFVVDSYFSRVQDDIETKFNFLLARLDPHWKKHFTSIVSNANTHRLSRHRAMSSCFLHMIWRERGRT